ncbi:unnamed protein product [Discosporangium mesarthrocarpum]
MKLADKCDKGCIWQRVKGQNGPRNRSPWSGNMFVCICWFFMQVDTSLKGVGVSFKGNQPLDVLTRAPCIHLPNCVYPILFFKGCVALFCITEGIYTQTSHKRERAGDDKTTMYFEVSVLIIAGEYIPGHLTRGKESTFQGVYIFAGGEESAIRVIRHVRITLIYRQRFFVLKNGSSVVCSI